MWKEGVYVKCEAPRAPLARISQKTRERSVRATAAHRFGRETRDAITVLLIARTERHKGIGSFYAFVADVDSLYAELSASGASILGPPVSYPWGLRDFRVLDPEGNRITFAQTFE